MYVCMYVHIYVYMYEIKSGNNGFRYGNNLHGTDVWCWVLLLQWRVGKSKHCKSYY